MANTLPPPLTLNTLDPQLTTLRFTSPHMTTTLPSWHHSGTHLATYAPTRPCNATHTPPSLPRPHNKRTMSRRNGTQPMSKPTGPLPPSLTLLHLCIWLNLLLVPSYSRTAQLILSYG
ncbi:hypothetical protein Pcinc_001412 [Petrolisthes cinctipes]|uniref:Uncharacterized protein n=1 Tax=Petrolisthes cinctipes TaxID=88211 RepID=A0AAE1GLM9_PETCI|nr:hypothetical protein Pcinc_001412 [Petrolisthes cinctipes]